MPFLLIVIFVNDFAASLRVRSILGLTASEIQPMIFVVYPQEFYAKHNERLFDLIGRRYAHWSN